MNRNSSKVAPLLKRAVKGEQAKMIEDLKQKGLLDRPVDILSRKAYENIKKADTATVTNMCVYETN